MLTIYSPLHERRHPSTELHGGRIVAPYESAERARIVLERVKSTGLGPVVAPEGFGLAPVYRVHDEAFVEFLANAWREWEAAGNEGEAIPNTWPARRMRQAPPASFAGRLGYYALAADSSISEGTWEAARAAADVALTGAARVLGGAPGAFSLCRPPGHHAARDLYGGYCFLNNAAIAAQALLDGGISRVAVLDVDFHHGNGTQDIFYDRDDVLFVSLHGDPAQCFPYFAGFPDETGAGAGAGFTLNFALPPGTGYAKWREALRAGLEAIRRSGAGALVVSLGVDTFEGDPISSFKLKSADFADYGQLIGSVGLPTLFVMEGGYAVAEIGTNVVNVLSGFERARP